MTGQLFIVAAPSGAGKTSLVQALLTRIPGLRLSISHTTRAPRVGEADGYDYHFVPEETFRDMIAAGDFLEWAKVHDNLYGTSRRWIAERLAEGIDVLLEIDWQGAKQVRAHFPESIGIFILPPNREALAQRLAGRGTDSAETIQKRLSAAEGEMRHAKEFGYIIVNDRFENALDDLYAVVRATQLTLARQQQQHPDLFVA
ncbi:MAG: guanylate kinase [Zoogloeaceae bacterium]|nr:guanylate kinase [Zoogloeaceae bacterium]